jgi:hypothetical protein
VLRNVLAMLLLLSCSTSFAGLFGPSNSDECIFDGLDEADTRSEIAALKRHCENKYEYERTDLFDPLLESCGFEGWAGSRWLPEKQAWVLINNLKSATMKWPRSSGGYGWVTLYNANDFGIDYIKVGILNSNNEYVAKYNFGRVEGIGGDVNYKLGASMPFSGDLSEYQWNIVNIAASMGDASLYLLGKQKGWCN